MYSPIFVRVTSLARGGGGALYSCFSASEVTLKDLHKFNRFLNITKHDIDASVQNCSIYSALAMEILQSCKKPSI